jgi:hypothetical protein
MMFHYPIELEKQFDPNTILRNETEIEEAAANDTRSKLSPQERRALIKAEMTQPVNYEYIFNDADFKTYDFDS